MEADEIFLTNSVIGVLPVSQINHQETKKYNTRSYYKKNWHTTSKIF